jgi:hypothetical protein
MDTATQTAARDISLADVQALNLETLRGYPELDTAARHASAEQVRAAASAAGAWIHEPAERDAAQSVLDYWTAQIGFLPNGKMPELDRILPFNEQNGKHLAATARKTYEALDETAQDDARRMFVRLYGAAEKTADAAPGDSTAQQAFTAAGILRAGAVVHPALLRTYWSLLDSWLADEDLHIAQVEAVEAAARAWDQAGAQSSYLLSGRRLTEAAQYRGTDPLVYAYIRAAKRAQRIRLASGALGVFVIAAIIGGLGYMLYFRPRAPATDQQVTARIKNEQAANQAVGLASAQTPATEISKIGATGFIWIGNTGFPILRTVGDKLDTKGANAPVDPTTVVAGDTVYGISIAVNLRGSMPDDSYVRGDVSGVLGQGARVQVAGPPKSFPRLTGPQYWAAVRQVVSVYITYNGPADKVASLAKDLSSATFAVQPSERTTNAAKSFKVLYYRKEDRAYAEKLMQALVARVRGTRGLKPQCDFRGTATVKAAPGVIEAWVDFDRLALRDRPLRVGVDAKPYCAAPTRPSAPSPNAEVPHADSAIAL